jgi:ATP-dependent Zn protease
LTLECIDGIDGRQGVVVVAATNHPDAIDRAILRSGRIERHVRMELPNDDERADILHFHLRGPVTVDELRKITTDLKDWSGADLEKLAREARRRARAANQPVQIDDVAGALPPLETISSEIVHRATVHESGHAIVARSLRRDCKVSISIRKQYRTFSSDSPRGGLTRYFNEPTDLDTRESLEMLICRTLAGAAAEEVLLGTRSTGWGGPQGSDLHVATVIAARMVCSLGMGKNLSFVMEADHSALNGSGRLPATVREEIDGILAKQFSRAKSIIASHRNMAEALAAELLERERLEPDDVKAIMDSLHPGPVEKRRDG